MAIDKQKETKVQASIRNVKVKYLQCNDIKFKRYIGKKIAGDIK